MSGITDKIKNTVHSGEPGSTGREVFEDSSATGPPSHLSQSGGQGGAAHGTGSLSSGVGSEVVGSGEGHHGHHHHHHSHANQGGSTDQTGSGVGSGVGSGLGVGETATQGGAAGTGGVYAEERRWADRGGAFDTNTGGFTGMAGGSYTGTGAGDYTGTVTGTEDLTSTGSTGIDSASLGSGAPAGYGTGVGSQEGQGVTGGQEGHHHHHSDRVGSLGQGQVLYEGNNEAPLTGGAAGTDRFDAGPAGKNNFDESNDTTQRAQGKGTGGLMGVFGTSDKDFTGRDRLGQSGSSAYTDDQGRFSGNTTGPGGSALTGREGNIDSNPVAQAKSRSEGTDTGTGTGTDETEPTQKKGLMEKIKDATGL